MTAPAATTLTALTRPVSASLAHCELTNMQREPIDLDRARAQHALYTAALADAGCNIAVLAAAPDLPDSVFIEDTAVVLDEIAVLTRPGAASRRAEVDAVAEALARVRPVARMQAPATLDGGDVLRVGRALYVGASGRTNSAGIAWLRDAVSPFGYSVTTVPTTGCLHLKTAVTAIAPDLLLINAGWVDRNHFAGIRTLDISPDEPFAANALLVRDRVIYHAGHVRTARMIREAGIDVVEVDVSELAKAEGGVTCCSLLVPDMRPG